MRVLHILEATLGGTRTHLLDLLPALAERGWQCGLAYSSLRNPAFPDDARDLESPGLGGALTWDIAMRRGPHPSDARAIRELVSVARSFRPRLLHAHSSKAGLLARFVGAALRVPVVYTPHCVAFDTALPHAQRRLARWGEVAMAPFSARLIAVSRAEARALERVVPIAAPKITLIRNGLDLRFFAQHGAPPSREVLTVGCFGRLCAQKNQGALLRALALVRRSGLDVRLMLVGSGEDEAKLRHLARALSLESSLEWVGEVADARPFYERCDIIALPSRWEGCPYSLLEAMASRRPVVASDIAPLQEILSDPFEPLSEPLGVLCHPAPEELARALSALARSPQRRQVLAEAARQRIERDFTLGRMADETARIYAEVARV